MPALFSKRRFLGAVVLGTAAMIGCSSNSTSSVPASITEKIQQTISSRTKNGSVADPGSAPRVSVAHERHEPIIRSFEDWTMPQVASFALGRIGAPAAPELARLLRSTDPAIRRQAAETLSRIGPGAAEAVPALVQALRDDDRAVRRMAARALGQIGPAAQAAVPDLINALQEPATH